MLSFVTLRILYNIHYAVIDHPSSLAGPFGPGGVKASIIDQMTATVPQEIEPIVVHCSPISQHKAASLFVVPHAAATSKVSIIVLSPHTFPPSRSPDEPTISNSIFPPRKVRLSLLVQLRIRYPTPMWTGRYDTRLVRVYREEPAQWIRHNYWP
jgi:hypothetical protein